MFLLVNMLSSIKNSQNIYSLYTICKKNNLCQSVLNKLINLGFIRGYFLQGSNVKILLKYYNNVPSIRNLKLLSKPGHKVYVSYINLYKLKNYKFRIYILSTSIGILTLEESIYFKVGGELIFYIL